MRTCKRQRHRGSAAGGGTADPVCHFGATRVAGLLHRLRLHLGTERFLARRRRDLVWEAGCDYAVMAVARLESQLTRTARTAPIAVRCPRG
jgi:hypothetical protein